MISKDQKENIICTIDECGETFYGRHTAQHPAAVIVNNNKCLDPLRAKKTFIRNKLGQTAVSAIQAKSFLTRPLPSPTIGLSFRSLCSILLVVNSRQSWRDWYPAPRRRMTCRAAVSLYQDKRVQLI